MNTLEHAVRITSALADPSRVRLLAACFTGEKCVCQLVALLDLSNATVSKHLSLLRDAGLLASRKEGRWVYYRLPETPTPAASDAIGFVQRHAGRTVEMAADKAQMERILAIEPTELCRRQRAGCCPDDPGRPGKAESDQAEEGRMSGRKPVSPGTNRSNR